MAILLYLLLCIVIFLTSGYLVLWFLAMGKPPTLRLIVATLGRDMDCLLKYFKVVWFIKKWQFLNQSVVHRFQEKVAKTPDSVCFVFEDENWTYKQVDELSNKVAHCFSQQGYQRGDEVALLMENCPDYICMWLGLAKIGVVTALINTNLKTDALAHSMNVIEMKGLIFGHGFFENLQNALPYINKKSAAKFYYTRKSEREKVYLSFPAVSLNVLLENASSAPLDPRKFKTNFEDRLMYIYTSGTTGLPKAAIIKHSRFLCGVSALTCFNIFPGPQISYNPLPLYHTSGSPVIFGQIVAVGGKVVIRKKFSASNYWKEFVKHKVTVCQYIGETCRYLLKQPKVPEETQHSVRVMVGTGLRPKIWKEFQERFKIERIFEVYAATEGNASLANFTGKPGACGFVSLLLTRFYPVLLIKINHESGEVLRDKNGLCIRCKPGETGELVSKVFENTAINAFDGYVNTSDTKKKILRDCLHKGDSFFLSGDIFVMDEDGYVYFKDRSGDTFRWKGENVSTAEVESVLSNVLDFASCIVYGVQIPDTEGRAGMAVVEADTKNIDFEKVFKYISERLPSYAIPIFVRVSSHIETTGTHKLKKFNFQKEGFNPEKIKDPLFVLDVKKKTYFPLTKEMYSDIVNGKYKL